MGRGGYRQERGLTGSYAALGSFLGLWGLGWLPDSPLPGRQGDGNNVEAGRVALWGAHTSRQASVPFRLPAAACCGS
jgi:hypothetical protein